MCLRFEPIDTVSGITYDQVVNQSQSFSSQEGGE